MKSKGKKALSGLLVFLLAAAALAGCTGGGSSSEPSAPPKGNTGGVQSEPAKPSDELKQVNGKYDPPVTITTVRGMPAAAAYKNGETADDNIHYRWTKETLGIEIKKIWITPSLF